MKKFFSMFLTSAFLVTGLVGVLPQDIQQVAVLSANAATLGYEKQDGWSNCKSTAVANALDLITGHDYTQYEPGFNNCSAAKIKQAIVNHGDSDVVSLANYDTDYATKDKDRQINALNYSLSLGVPIIVEVRGNPEQHWVTAIRGTANGFTYIDPASGNEKSGNTDTLGSVSGYCGYVSFNVSNAPPVNPNDITITANDVAAIPSQINPGQAVSIRGTVNANGGSLDWVRVGFLYANDSNWVEGGTHGDAYGNLGLSYNIAKQDSQVRFDWLPSGDYFFVIVARVSGGEPKTIYTQPLKVGTSAPSLDIQLEPNTTTFFEGSKAKLTVTSNDTADNIVFSLTGEYNNYRVNSTWFYHDLSVLKKGDYVLTAEAFKSGVSSGKKSVSFKIIEKNPSYTNLSMSSTGFYVNQSPDVIWNSNATNAHYKNVRIADGLTSESDVPPSFKTTFIPGDLKAGRWNLTVDFWNEVDGVKGSKISKTVEYRVIDTPPSGFRDVTESFYESNKLKQLSLKSLQTNGYATVQTDYSNVPVVVSNLSNVTDKEKFYVGLTSGKWAIFKSVANSKYLSVSDTDSLLYANKTSPGNTEYFKIYQYNGAYYLLSYSSGRPVYANFNKSPAPLTALGTFDGSWEKLDISEVAAKPISDLSVSVTNTMLIYSGEEKKPTITIKDGSKMLIENTDYTVSYSNNINVTSSAKATITGKGNYNGTKIVNFSITGRNISYLYGDVNGNGTLDKADATALQDYIYNGKQLAYQTYADIDGNGKIEFFDMTALSNAIYGDDKYNVKVSLNESQVTYDGRAKTPSVSVKFGTKTLVNGTDYNLSYSNNINVGTARVTVTGIGNFKGTVNKTFTIVNSFPKTVVGINDISASDIILSQTSFQYTGNTITPSVAVKYSERGSTRTLVSGTDYTLSYSNNVNAGTAKVTVTGKGNFKGTVSKNFTITAATIKNSAPTISTTSYPSSIKQGNTFALRGTITAGQYPLERIFIGVYNDRGQWVGEVQWHQYVSVASGGTFDIYSKCNSSLKFEKLQKGSYTLRIAAVPKTGNEVQKHYSFTIT